MVHVSWQDARYQSSRFNSPQSPRQTSLTRSDHSSQPWLQSTSLPLPNTTMPSRTRLLEYSIDTSCWLSALLLLQVAQKVRTLMNAIEAPSLTATSKDGTKDPLLLLPNSSHSSNITTSTARLTRRQSPMSFLCQPRSWYRCTALFLFQ